MNHDFLSQLRKLLLDRAGGNLSDDQLLERFIAERDEVAFEALVRRHGPMVLRVCRHVVGDEHDAEDAFQATFLVLARRAETIVPRDRVSRWLCGVAFRTAQAARATRYRRQTREREMFFQQPRHAAAPSDEPDLLPLLDQELNRLPEKFRLPIILCGVEGRGRKEVAAQLSLPEGTLASRLDTARRLLAKRLARYGIAVSAAVVVLALPKEGLANVPASLIAATLPARLATAPATVLALAQGVLRAAVWLRVKLAAALLLCTLGGLGGGWTAWQAAPAPAPTAFAPHSAPSQEQPVAQHQLSEEEQLQGVWNVLRCERDGEAVPLSERAGKQLVFVQDDKVMTHFFRSRKGHNFIAATVRLDATTTPKTIEVLHGNGRLWEGIYRLDDDTLQVCLVPFGQPRPTTFTTTANSAPLLVILQRDNSMVWNLAKWQHALEERS